MKKKLISMLLALSLVLTMMPASAFTAYAAGTSVKLNATNFPDANFRAYLADEVDINGDGTLSATEIADVEYMDLWSEGISDLTGIGYFDELISLDCSENNLTKLPTLPAGLEDLYCWGNDLTALPTLPAGLTHLDCEDDNLAALPTLPSGLEYLNCGYNALTTLPALPAGLEDLYCWENDLTALPTLPAGLTYLGCSDNNLAALPTLPTGLTSLSCSDNNLAALPTLPSGLEYLDCGHNALTTLPALPEGLGHLTCCGNELKTLPKLPTALEELTCWGNNLTALPELPAKLSVLYCEYNELTQLPPLPSGLEALYCGDNQLTGTLDVSHCEFLTDFDCSYNNLTKVILCDSADYEWIDMSGNSLLTKPVIKVTNNNSTGKPVISWNKVSGASKYELWMSTGGSYRMIGSTTGTSITHNSATSGSLYYYKIKAVDTSINAESDFSDRKYIRCKYAKPVIKLTNNEKTGKPVISWSKVSGASKYELWMSTGGTYKMIGTTTGTSITHNSATAGSLYYYKVKAVGSNANAASAFSDRKYIRCKYAKPVINVKTNSAGKPVISWNKVTGASKYELWMSTGGSYNKIGTTTGTSITHNSAKKGTLYYYKVKAVGSNSSAASAFSDRKYIRCK